VVNLVGISRLEINPIEFIRIMMEENILSESIIDILVKETNEKNLRKAA